MVVFPEVRIAMSSIVKVSVGLGNLEGDTATVTLVVAVPPSPVHEIEKVLVALSGPTPSEPDTDLAPVHAP
jgi:hypothetical protein